MRARAAAAPMRGRTRRSSLADRAPRPRTKRLAISEPGSGCCRAWSRARGCSRCRPSPSENVAGGEICTAPGVRRHLGDAPIDGGEVPTAVLRAVDTGPFPCRRGSSSPVVTKYRPNVCAKSFPFARADAHVACSFRWRSRALQSLKMQWPGVPPLFRTSERLPRQYRQAREKRDAPEEQRLHPLEFRRGRCGCARRAALDPADRCRAWAPEVRKTCYLDNCAQSAATPRLGLDHLRLTDR